jgi:DNA-binding response OmpR family regulator
MVSSSEEAYQLMENQVYHLILLDINLPGITGFEICRELRRARIRTPILMLTARTQEAEKVIGLELGADDYVTKPFSPRELVLRVGAVLRRAQGPVPTDQRGLVDGDLRIDTAAHEVVLGDRVLALTAREYDLLVFLLRHPRTFVIPKAAARADVEENAGSGDLVLGADEIARLEEAFPRPRSKALPFL